MQKLIKILLGVTLMLLFIGCTNQATPYAGGNKELPDSVFYLTIKRALPLKVPCAFKSKPSDSELVDLRFVRSLRDTATRTMDSLFLIRYICEYDNFCRYRSVLQGWDYRLFQEGQLNDSIYIITYFDDEVMGDKLGNYENQPKVIIVTYNVKQSRKPVDKLVLYGYKKGLFELWSTIDSDFYIETTHYMSLKGHYKQYPGYGEYEFDLLFNITNYHLKANGEFEPFSFLSGTRRGIQLEGEHFSFSENDTVILEEVWEKDSQLNIVELAKKVGGAKGLTIGNHFPTIDSAGGK